MHEVTLAIEHDIETVVVNATRSGRVYKALTGKKVIGTILSRKG
jgi:aspartokinase-like uncharacterized kinase